MIGTIANACGIVVGCLIGRLLKRGIKPEWQTALFSAMGLASVGLGVNAICQNMPQSRYPVLYVAAMAIGTLIGTILNIDRRFRAICPKGNGLAEGLTTACLLYCIGTLSILGPINSALLGDETYLYTNATLDTVSSIVFSATYGFGIALAAVVLFCWQGGIYLIAKLCGNVIPPDLLAEMATVGGTLIVASGLTLLKVKDCKTLNMLPALAVPGIWYVIRMLW